MRKYLQIGLKLTAANWRMVAFLYGIGLALGLLVTRPFFQTARFEANGSMALEGLLRDFDYMVFTDFLRLHGSAFRPLLLVAFMLGLLMLVLNCLFLGGILRQLRWPLGSFSLSQFIQNGLPTFGTYLILLLIEGVVFCCVLFASGLFFFVFALIAEGGNERTYFLWMLPPIGLLAFGISILLTACDYARIILHSHPQMNAWRGFGWGINYVFRHFRTVGMFWQIIGLGIGIGLLYILSGVFIGSSSWLTVFLLFVVQQAFVFGRTFLKVANYGMAQAFYETHPVLINVKMPDDLPENDSSDDALQPEEPA